MTKQHLEALLAAAGAKTGSDGWANVEEGRSMTFYIASAGASLTVGRVEAVRATGDLLYTRSVRNEQFVLNLADVFAGAVDGPREGARKAGFV